MNPIRTIVKFYTNPHTNSPNAIITRTMLKVGIIDSAWKSNVYPLDGEFWYVEIVRETCPKMNKGCFILAPIHKVDPKDISKLIPGMYEEDLQDGVLYIKAKNPELTNPILPLKHKKNIKAVHAIIVHA